MLMVVCLILPIIACNTTPDSEPTNSESQTDSQVEVPDKKFKVGINNWGVANFFAREGKAALEDELAKLGCEVVATVTDDIAGRMDAIDNFVQQGVDAIIVQEGDINEAATACREAKERGIIIGSMDSGDADFVDIYVSSDNQELGASIARIMVEAIGGEGKIVEITNDAGSMIRQRREAFHKVLEDYPDIEIVQNLTYAWPDYYSDILSKMEAVLQANPNPGDIVGVFASFDGVGVASADAIREFGLTDSIVVVGIDGDPDAYAEMRKEDSNFIATMAQDPDTIARLTVRGVVDLLNGKELEEKVIYVPGILITQDNIPNK